MHIPYVKIAIYALTFLTYAYSGYGAGVLGNVRDALIAAEAVFGDILKNIITVAKKFKVIHDVFDAAVEENCRYTCPDGKFANELTQVQYIKVTVYNFRYLCSVKVMTFNIFIFYQIN